MRIVAGKHKGLSLFEFDAENIRPTSDRVRENIFNKIQFRIMDSVVLDLFGGTGAVSLEFVSRGAKEVIICDNNKNSINLITKNFNKAKEKLNLINGDYKDCLKKLSDKKFDIIFLDPPYASNFGEESINLIVSYKILKEDGIIVFEHLLDTNYKIPNELELLDCRKYGTIEVSFLGWKNND